MKVNIDENGIMTVTSETPMEAFALKAWGLEATAEFKFKDSRQIKETFIRGSKFVTVLSTDRDCHE